MAASSKLTDPSQQSMRPKTAFMNVDFPAPFGPMMQTISSSSTSIETPWRIWASPYPETMSRASKRAMDYPPR
jgi:hypothetical protein